MVRLVIWNAIAPIMTSQFWKSVAYDYNALLYMSSEMLCGLNTWLHTILLELRV